jgi:hypothetical protein
VQVRDSLAIDLGAMSWALFLSLSAFSLEAVEVALAFVDES